MPPCRIVCCRISGFVNKKIKRTTRGAQNFIEHWERATSSKKPVGTEAFRLGRDLALTPGKVITRLSEAAVH